MTGRKATRESDERTLEWVRLRSEGHSCTRIAERFGVSKTLVQRYTNAVYEADVKTCGEKVAKDYW